MNSTYRIRRNFIRNELPRILDRNKFTPLPNNNLFVIAKHLEKILGIEAPRPGERDSRPGRRCKKALYLFLDKYDPPSRLVLFGKPPFRKPAVDKQDLDPIKRFYNSLAWSNLRYRITSKYGKVCMCCGTVEGPTYENGFREIRVIHVDHIKPVRKYWHLRLDPNNLQVLCNLCNRGKGNWDETDFRPKSLKRVPMRPN